ncbi:HMA2 domain-containing protein [Gloeothece verrucosa]|uniref:Uncharacterized protein n=1 Tax=Gloeothece verrucosa (strain PCC 7822) TaxID=497965 RepID=E0UDR6_GLOV7|nr:hypothetical protein [Gloeothece verrucosa]ADN16501.1 hypothetical protein Cyan7822_4593 [Gloeothece verrucosa PCC 7822]
MQDQIAKLDYQVIHAIAGRIRLKYPRLKIDSGYREQLQQSIKSLNAVRDVRISPATASIIVSYDPHSFNQKTIETELAKCLQQGGNSSVCLACALESPELVETEDKKLETANSLISQSNDSVIEPYSPVIEELEKEVTDVLKTSSGLQIPPECLSNIDQFPINIDQQGEIFEIGIPAFCFLQPLNTELKKIADENEKKSELQIINLDLEPSFQEGGLLINGTAKGKFRQYLFINPFTGKKYYTPWISLTAVGIAALSTSVIDETLKVQLTELKITGQRGKWYKKLVEFGFEHFFKAQLVSKINEFLAEINGAKIQQLFFQIKGDERLRANHQALGLNAEKIDALLSLVQVNARIAPDYLWLSVQL